MIVRCAVFALCSSFLGFMGCSPDSHAPAGAVLSAGAAREIEDYINARLDIVEAMPGHPESASLYKHVLSRWRYDTGASEEEIAWRLAGMLPDSPLGLYAFSQLLAGLDTEDDHRAYLDTMIAEHPETRAASFAFDQLLKAMDDPDAAQHACETAIRQYGEGRLGVFARIRLGDCLEKTGQPEQAAEQRLLAWQVDSSRGSQVFDGLYLYWQSRDAWYRPLLFAQPLLNTAALNELKECALWELRQYDFSRTSTSDIAEDDGYGRFIAQLRAGGAAITRHRLSEGADAFEAALEVIPETELTVSASTDYGLALFLLEIPSGNSESEGGGSSAMEDEWTLQARLRAIQDAGLALAESGLDRYPESLGNHYRLAVARMYRSRAQPREAVHWLEGQALQTALSSESRLNAVTLLTEIYSQDLNMPQESARIYLACVDLEDNPEYSFQAAFQYYQMNSYYESDALLTALLSKDEAYLGERHADILYLAGLSRFRLGNVSGAETALNTLVRSYPKHKLAPEALLLLAQQASVSHQGRKMFELLERIESEYSDTAAARSAAFYLETLRSYE